MEKMTLPDVVKKLCSSDKYEPDVQWCLSELHDILEIIGDTSGDRLRELVQANVAPEQSENIVNFSTICREVGKEKKMEKEKCNQCSTCINERLVEKRNRQILELLKGIKDLQNANQELLLALKNLIELNPELGQSLESKIQE